MNSEVGMKHPAATSSFTSIPLVDMGPLQDGGAKSRLALAEDICQFCETVGFLYIVNHGIPQTLIADTFRVANEFFALPAQEKLKLRLGGGTGFRGYLPAGIDGGTSAGNRKEAFQIIREVANPSEERGPRAVLARPNLWPGVQPVFRQTVLEYFAAVEALAATLLRLFAIGLGVAETTFTSKFQAPVSMLRLLHYPPQASMEGAIGSQPHTDTGALTILAQDDAGGLEAVNDLDQWTPVAPIDGSLVVNLGGMMKLWSDGRFSATPHRVINMSGKDRISIPYFASPDFDTVISPVISAKTRRNEMQLVGHLQRDETASSGELLLRSWNRLWGPAVPAS